MALPTARWPVRLERLQSAQRDCPVGLGLMAGPYGFTGMYVSESATAKGIIWDRPHICESDSVWRVRPVMNCDNNSNLPHLRAEVACPRPRVASPGPG